MPFLDLNTIRIYYETCGDPWMPPLLLIAGLSDVAAKTKWQTAELADDFYTIVFDNRGAGRSTAPEPGYAITDMADDVLAILDALAVPTTHIFGFSMGGMIATELALRHPERVRRLALGCTTAGGPLSVSPREAVVQALSEPQDTGDRRRDFYDRIWMSVSERTVDRDPGLLGKLLELDTSYSQSPIGYAGQLQALLGHDVSGRLAEIRAPTLVLHGEDDLKIPAENGRLLARNIPGARLKLYPRAGHLFFIEQATAVNADLRDFFLQDELMGEKS